MGTWGHRRIGLEIKLRTRDTGPQILRGRRTETRRTLTQACRSPSNRSGILGSMQPRELGRIFIWKRNHSYKHLYRLSSKGRIPPYWDRRPKARQFKIAHSPYRTKHRYTDLPGKMDGLMRAHWTPCCSPTMPRQFPVRGTSPTILGWIHGDQEA